MRIGDKIQGVITGIQPYGAFVDLNNGTTGLIHISEITTGYVDDIRASLTVGEMVLVQIIDFDEYSGKVSLSLRTLEEEKHAFPSHHRFTNDRNKTGFTPLRKQLPVWIKESTEFLKEKNAEADSK